MWWLFKKNNLNKKIEHIHNSVQNSFLNVKEDITKLGNWMNEIHSHHTDRSDILNKKLLQIEKRLNKIENYFSKEEKEDEIPIKKLSKEEIEIESMLTTQQGVYLMRMVSLLNESGGEWIPMKTLAETLYPRTKYPNVKSLISDYTEILSTWGLLKKRRKGREALLLLTEKGHKVAKKLLQKEKKLFSS